MEQNFESVGAITGERRLASECAVVLVLVADEKRKKEMSKIVTFEPLQNSSLQREPNENEKRELTGGHSLPPV